MAAPFFPRRRILPELLSTLIVYGLIAIGATTFASSVLSGSPSFPDIYERLPVALFALLPVALLVILGLRLRRLALDLRARRYGSRLRLRLSGLFLFLVAAASLPQGFFLLRLAASAQASSSSSVMRTALSEGQALALAWYDEELGRIEGAGAGLSLEYSGSKRAQALLEELQRRDPRMEALELFDGPTSIDYAGAGAARLASSPPSFGPGSKGHLLAASASGATNLVRYAVSVGGGTRIAVLSLRLPEALDRAAAALGKAERTAVFLAPFSTKWSQLLVLLYCFLVLPLLSPPPFSPAWQPISSRNPS